MGIQKFDGPNYDIFNQKYDYKKRNKIDGISERENQNHEFQEMDLDLARRKHN